LERFRREEVLSHAEQLSHLHERAAQFRRALDDTTRVPDVGLEQRRFLLRAGLEGTLERLPQVAAADRCRQPADRQYPASTPRGDVRHHRRRLMRAAAAAAPKPLSMFTTV